MMRVSVLHPSADEQKHNMRKLTYQGVNAKGFYLLPYSIGLTTQLLSPRDMILRLDHSLFTIPHLDGNNSRGECKMVLSAYVINST